MREAVPYIVFIIIIIIAFRAYYKIRNKTGKTTICGTCNVCREKNIYSIEMSMIPDTCPFREDIRKKLESRDLYENQEDVHKDEEV